LVSEINESCPQSCILSGNAIDEAVPVLAMASDWLQLDSTDDWVRHDSEIVSPFCEKRCVYKHRGAIFAELIVLR
jgi:hypothetical protein